MKIMRKEEKQLLNTRKNVRKKKKKKQYGTTCERRNSTARMKVIQNVREIIIANEGKTIGNGNKTGLKNKRQ